MAEKKVKVEKKETKKEIKTERKPVFKKKKQGTNNQAPIQPDMKKVKVSRRQQGYDDKKSKLAVKGRQTKWAPVWVVMKKYGTGKRVHPAATTAVKRSWRRTKLHIKPRRIKKWHLG